MQTGDNWAVWLSRSAAGFKAGEGISPSKLGDVMNCVDSLLDL